MHRLTQDCTDRTILRNLKARDFAVRLFEYLTKGAATGKVIIEPNPIRKMPGGIERIVPDGFQLLGAGVLSSALRGEKSRTEEHMRPISAEKLVYALTK
jgi:hypothetical protein